jgi:peptide chain release factor 3
VGALQLEVLQYRLEHEYGATCRYESASLHKACWLACDDDTVMDKFRQRKLQSLARDKHGTYVYLAQSSWDLNSTQELFPEVKFYFTSEMK